MKVQISDISKHRRSLSSRFLLLVDALLEAEKTNKGVRIDLEEGDGGFSATQVTGILQRSDTNRILGVPYARRRKVGENSYEMWIERRKT